jgi:hypothetical protein
MRIFGYEEIVILTDYSVENVIYILEKRMECKADGNRLQEKFEQGPLSTVAYVICWVNKTDDTTAVTVRFRLAPYNIVWLCVTFTFGLFGVIYAISHREFSSLLAMLPFVIVYLVSLLGYTIQKVNKKYNLKRFLGCREP